MKIVHIETGRHMYGGAQQVIYLLEGLTQRGHDVVLICTENSAVAERARTVGFRAEPMACAGEMDLEFMLRIRHLLRQEKPDLVHIHSRRGADTLGLMAARWVGIPTIISRRVDNPEPRWLARLKYGRCAAVITISNAIRQILISSGVQAQKVSTVRSAVDAHRFRNPVPRQDFLEEFGIEENQLVVGVVAQLIARKNHLHLLRALVTEKYNLSSVKVIFFGQGAMEEKLRIAVQNLDLEEQVIFAGFREDMASLIGHIDILVHPASMEGLGVSLIEAAAAGVPIIANPAGGIPEVVRDRINGILVDCSDSIALAEALSQLIANAVLRKRMGDAGRQLVDDEFSIDAMVEGNLAVYRQVSSQ